MQSARSSSCSRQGPNVRQGLGMVYYNVDHVMEALKACNVNLSGKTVEVFHTGQHYVRYPVDAQTSAISTDGNAQAPGEHG
ncbi:hypothetical protein ml_450 [Mollivirus sibericum]|uniref:hypothetical protein n=1 Tax=Mollivirus sibericum TaxID=1678078 RepID=UPI0006B2E0F4|nr:hypothetical protein ml_450 [Mollivirus sibericum]ALD62252.1 hypothetical protein ml_450 [Mollivirus sibericum]